MSDAQVRPQLVLADRWDQIRCPQNQRLFDVNHARLLVRILCERCRITHTVEVGVRYTDGSR